MAAEMEAHSAKVIIAEYEALELAYFAVVDGEHTEAEEAEAYKAYYAANQAYKALVKS